MNEQHNHHCLLTFMGQNWSIWRMRRYLIDVCIVIDRGRYAFTTIDMSHVDFEAYCIAAEEWDRRTDAC